MYLLQLFTLLFTIAFAWYSKIPILKMINHGASLNEEREFHRFSAWVRLLFLMGASFHLTGWEFLLGFAAACLLQWVAFDIAINIAIGRKWYSLGNTAWIDRTLKEAYGEDAGKWKAALCVAVVVLLNLLYLFL
jgi:hypothetical protein